MTNLYLLAALAVSLACISIASTIAFFTLASWSERKQKEGIMHMPIDSAISSDSIAETLTRSELK